MMGVLATSRDGQGWQGVLADKGVRVRACTTAPTVRQVPLLAPPNNVAWAPLPMTRQRFIVA